MNVEPSQETKRWYRVGVVKCAMLALVYAGALGLTAYHYPQNRTHDIAPYFLWFLGCYGLAVLGYLAILRDVRKQRRASWHTQLLIYASLIGIPITWPVIMGITVFSMFFAMWVGFVGGLTVAFIIYGLWLSPLMLMWKYQMYYKNFRYRKWLI